MREYLISTAASVIHEVIGRFEAKPLLISIRVEFCFRMSIFPKNVLLKNLQAILAITKYKL